MSEFKDNTEILVVCDCGRKITVQTENTVRIVRPSLEAKDTGERLNSNKLT